MITPTGGLSIGARIMYLRAGLLSESQIRDLIYDAMTQNMIHYLPQELREYGAVMLRTGKMRLPES
jgi:hypothetical protein